MLLDAILGTGERVTAAIRSASQSTGVNFDYLLKTAIRESALDPKAAASTSSARGLFQFIDTTWLQTVKEDGPAFGLQNEANAIERAADGQYVVRDPLTRARILKLRENPEIASVMAGAFSRRNAAEVSSVLGRQPTSGELYIAHFLGASGAKRFLNLRNAQPNASAVAAFPDPARANRSIFFNRDGSARSIEGVYQSLVAKHDRTRPVDATAVAAATPERTNFGGIPAFLNRVVAAFTPSRAAPIQRASAPQLVTAATRAVTPARAPIPNSAIVTASINPAVEVPPIARSDEPMFRGLFQNAPNSPLSPSVRDLWGGVNPMARRT